MQYYKCQKCKHKGNMCQFLVANGLAALYAVVSTTNKGLSYMRYKSNSQITIDIDFKCNGYSPRGGINESE